MSWRDVLPVVISVLIIILFAVLRKTSSSLAAILATMPLNIPLTLWITYSSLEGDAASRSNALTEFTQALLFNIIPTVVFIGVAWWGFRAGWSFLAVLAAGYAAWGVVLGVILVLRGG
jgi:hypothetical protein